MKLAIRQSEIKLTGEWAGWQFTARMNPPLGVFWDITSGDLQRLVAGMAKIILAWNFVDEDGNALGAPSLETMNTYITPELLNVIAGAYIDEMTKLPPA